MRKKNINSYSGPQLRSNEINEKFSHSAVKFSFDEDSYRAKLEEMHRDRENRHKYDIITVGEGRKPQQLMHQPEKVPESEKIPLYRLTCREITDYDVTNMHQPTLKSVRTIMNRSITQKHFPLMITKNKISQMRTEGQLFIKPSDSSAIKRITVDPDPDELLMISIQQAGKTQLKSSYESSIAPNDEVEIKKLHTADDTIAYFSKHRSNSTVKYVYLNQAHQSLEFRPYDLNVVLRGQQNPEHYVISSTGVVHIKPGHPSEVILLSDWMRESAMFNILRKIRFFKIYLTYKAFVNWRKNVRLRLYSEIRRKLCRKLFISRATFAVPTMDLVKTAYDLTNTNILHYDAVGKQDYTIEEFTTQQSEQRSKAIIELTSTVEKMEGCLTKLTENIQQRANVPNFTSIESLEQYLYASAVAAGKEKASQRKTKSIIEFKKEQFERMCELKRSLVEYSMVENYIRLIDYVASELIFKNALSSIQKFYNIIHEQSTKEVKIVGFQILIYPTDDSLVFRPTFSDIDRVHFELVEDIVQTVNSVSRLLNQKPLKMYFSKNPKFWNIGAEYKRDARIIDVRRRIKELISIDFDLANVKMRLYKTILPSLSFIEKGWLEVREEWRFNKDSLLCDEITQVYDKLDQALASFKVLMASFVGHILYINAARLKSELEPKVRLIKEEVDCVLAEVARDRTKKLQAYFIKNRALLIPPPLDKKIELHRFVDFIVNLNDVNNKKNEIIENGIEADNLYALMEKQGVEINDEDKQLRELTLGLPNHQGLIKPLRDVFFQEILENAEAFRDKEIEGVTNILIEEVKLLQDKCEGYEQALRGDEYAMSTDIPETILEQLEHVGIELSNIHEESVALNRCADLLNTKIDWSSLDAFQAIYDARSEAWTLLDTYNKKIDYWFETPLIEFDISEIDTEVKELYQKAFKLNQSMIQNHYNDEVCPHLIECLKEMKEHMPVILDCGNKNMTAEHWNKIFYEISGGMYAYDEGLNLNSLRERDIWSFKDVIAEQSGIATGEANLVKALDEIKAVWDCIDFTTKKYKEDSNVYILQTLDEILQQLDDHQAQLQTIMASRFIGGVRERVEEWNNNLRTVSEVLDEWVTLQKNWMYLEFIFSSDDIKRQLPEESERFDFVDCLFKDLMDKVNTVKNVITICTEDELLETLRENNRAIDHIQKKLEDYLEVKRVAFPRFYFLSNDELLSILSDVRNPRSVQPHLSKCFDNISALIFNNESASEIGGMKSAEGEEVKFNQVVKPIGNVEHWLCQIEATMKSSLKNHMKETIGAYSQSAREKWFFEFPAQCIQAVDMIVWTGETENAISNNNLKEYHNDYHKQIINTVEIVKKQLNKLQRTLVCTLIVVDVHNRDVVKRLSDAKVDTLSDFEWIQQLKYFWEQDNSINDLNVGIYHCSAHLWYGYEYLGNQPRLVITPLTDRAFLTCTSALGMNLGAAPQGPAGTGKTESVKDLGKALARQVVVFNCSDGINYKTMSRMFAGLAQAGAWACFDEFNRIELEVLSVIAQQMLEITTALEQNLDNMDFDGHPIKLNRNFGVFITMNPGYAGRTELPDNLKALFRPICMMIPDYALIAEIMFYSEGFSEANVLAQKMVQLYKLSSEQLSKQDHYDFGMRAVKSILVMAGGLKRDNPTEPEDMLLIRAMRDSNVPKFLREDTILFMALIKDLFPSIEIEEKNSDLLVKYLNIDIEKNNLQIVDGFILKALQLFDTIVVRHGVMMVGQTYSAKTTIVSTLQRTLTSIKADGVDPEGQIQLFNKVKTHVVNPKSVSLGELYGEVNAITREWTDGILSNIARNITKEFQVNLDRHWLVFDGPVDALWIENMNTVLDDNKLLCLFNGERIKLPPTATFMFEVQDLRVASPATVSRCGMVYTEPYYLDGGRGWRPIARSLAEEIQKTVPKFNANRVIELVEYLSEPTLDYIRSNCKEYIPSVDAQLVVSCLYLLKGFIISLDLPYEEIPKDIEPEVMSMPSKESETPGDCETENTISPSSLMLMEFKRPKIVHGDVPSNNETLLDMYFIIAFAWAFGGNLVEESRQKFDEFIRPYFEQKFNKILPTHFNSIFEFTVHRPSMKFIKWEFTVPDFFYNSNMSYFDLFVPTVESTSMKFIMKILSSISRHILVNGVTGVGKSIVIQDFLNYTLKANDTESSYEYFYTTFSAQTKSKDVEDKIDSKLHKLRTNLIGPSPGKNAIFFIDDLNMPSLEQYGASPPIELIRQIISQEGFYDKSKSPAVFKNIKGLSFISACGVPGGGKNEITQRLTSRFQLLCQASVTSQSIRRIFISILAGFFSSFSEEVQSTIPKIIASTKECYDRISVEKLPTPDKSHYIFNLRDFGKVVQGILQVTPQTIQSKEGIIRLYIHEITRVFHDRLTDTKDREWWWTTVNQIIQEKFEVEWNSSLQELIFGDYMNQGKHIYEEIPSIEEFQGKLVEYQHMYNIDFNKETELVFFSDAAHHISRICRICRQPRGHALLVGVSGSGRQSLTRLASFMCEMPLFQISVTRSYTMNDFRDNLKNILIQGGCGNKHVVFLLSDAQIIYEQMLEDVNNILSTGEVPNLMQNEDMETIIESMRPIVSAANLPETRNLMMSQFVKLCRDNVHIILTMSPIGDKFRHRLRMFPSLVNCMTIDWFSKWPSEALVSVAHQVFSKHEISDNIKEALCHLCVFIHQNVDELSNQFHQELLRRNYTTPTSYIELLNSYTSMLEEQNISINNQINRLQGGLDKLHFTHIMVDEMKLSLEKMQPVLEESAKETSQILKQVETEKKDVVVLELECAKEEEVAMEIKRTADAVRQDCQKDLDHVMPILIAANEALNEIDDASIREMKSFAKPPEKVGKVMEGVLILFGEKELKWDKSKLLLGRIDFIPSLRNFPKDDIQEKTIKLLQKHYVCSEECTPEEVRKTSVAAEGIYKWVIAMIQYFKATRIVAPKKAQLAVAEQKLEAAKQAQQAALDKLEKVQQRVASLQKKLQDNLDKKKQLENEINLTKTRLGRAEKLMTGLSSEQVRWMDSVEKMKFGQQYTFGNVIISAGVVAYLGPFTAPYREKAISCWIKKCKEFRIPLPDSEFNLADIVDPVIIRDWGQKGLPMDSFSIQNGIIATRSQRWCLCIDPQGQANNWFRATQKEKKLKIIKLTDNNYIRTLENAIKVGIPVLLENIEESIDTALDPVLLRQTFKSQGRTLLRLGDQEIDYDPNFKLYITTKLSNPHYLPELQIKVTIINFTVTQQGLEEQLLADVVRYECNELETRADSTIVEIAQNKNALKDTEDKMLSLLASSTGNILDNQVLIDTLQEAKRTSESILLNLKVSEETQINIQVARNRYRPVATRGSIIYTVISEISGVNHMYQISLDFFKKLFIQTLKKTETNENVDERVSSLIPAVTYASYNTISRGLFEKDKQIFIFLLVSHIFRAIGEFSSLEWNFFLKGTDGRRLIDPDEDRWPEWTNENSWNEFAHLSLLPGFEQLKEELWSMEDEWRIWVNNDLAYKNYPSALNKFSEWHKLLVLKTFREDLVMHGMTYVTGHYLGKEFMENPQFDLDASFLDSSPTAPIIFVLTSGTDPTVTFTEFAERRGFGERKLMLSLGQDQGVKAQEMISIACKNGSWVYLQNCHVYASWMPQLERILEDIRLRDIHKDFRLWLTTMPNPDFPVLVLQSGIKIVKEPPKGLKSNIRDTFQLSITPEIWDSCPQNSVCWKRLLFSLSYIHAIIQERRRFGPIGWNIPYEWNQSDYSASLKSLYTYIADYQVVPWIALNYMTGVINYGGRVTDFLDQRCLLTVVSQFFNDEVIVEEDYNLTNDGVYRIPKDVSDLEIVRNYLADLPQFEQPELFGLNANADITYNRSNSREQLATILSVEPKTISGVGISPNEQVLELAQMFEKKLPPLIDINNGHKETYRITPDGTMISLGTVAKQEIDVFNNIISKLHSYLTELQKAIMGEVIMSQRLEEMYNSFLLGKVPDLWHVGSYLSLKPLGSWFEDTLNRIEFLRDWNDNGMPPSYWISGFFFPQGFLTGVLQTHSRANKMPIDEIKFKTHITNYTSLDQVDMPPDTGVYIHGLFMEGARFNRDIMAVDESVKGDIFSPVPVIWLEPVSRSVVTVRDDTYVCPMYKTSKRAGALSTTGLSTNYVLSLDFDSGRNKPDHWILRGVALLCMLDD